jgi:hypothetical protein
VPSKQRFLFHLVSCFSKNVVLKWCLAFYQTVSPLDFVHLVRGRRGRVRSSPVRHREVMMRTLPTTMLHLLNPFVPLFSRRLWQGAYGLTSKCS